MKYFLDFEFLEGDVPVKIFGLNIPKWLVKPNNTIQPISVGIVAEDSVPVDKNFPTIKGREYYTISKDFNLYEAWNRYDLKKDAGKPQYLGDTKVYWIRDNVLYPIWKELSHKDYLDYNGKTHGKSINIGEGMTYKSLKQLINKYGKTNKEIADDIVHFTYGVYTPVANGISTGVIRDNNVQFYGYFSAYDWVAFCWLFGKMINLPKNISWYCRDLKQELDSLIKQPIEVVDSNGNRPSFNDLIRRFSSYPNYPKKSNEHNALSDAKWNKELHNFINNL
jgi:hypothetical protein